jgi:hypothetical protein
MLDLKPPLILFKTGTTDFDITANAQLTLVEYSSLKLGEEDSKPLEKEAEGVDKN